MTGHAHAVGADAAGPRPSARHRHAWRRGCLVAAVLALAATLLPARPAIAYPDPQPAGRFPVVPGLIREAYTYRTSHGPVRIQVLRFRRDDPAISLSPELADGHVPGREATHETLRRRGESAVAGVNANFFFSRPGPYGEPEGLFIRHRTLMSEPETKGRGYRGAFALFPDNSYEVALPSFHGRIIQPDGQEVPLNGINKHPSPRTSQVTMLARSFYPTTLTPSGTTEVVLRNVAPRLNLRGTFRVAGVSTSGNTPIPDDGVVLAASGDYGRWWRNLRPGDELEIIARSDVPNWDDAKHAVGAGPLIVKDGQVTPESSWNTEGFGPRHNRQTHPRTLVGFRAGREVLLVTVDGRRSGHSVGLTTAEAAHLMQHFDVDDAVMMDGGGSTTMAVDGAIVNRPCCDAAGYREVGSSLVVHANTDYPSVDRIGDYNRYATARAVARAGWGREGARTAVLASGETFPDALAGGPFAAKLNAPLLLTAESWLPWSTRNALQELRVNRVRVLGGPGAVSDDVVEDLRARGYRVDRVAGKERTQTAAAIAIATGAPRRRVFLASAQNFPDALSAAVPAHLASSPLLTTWKDRVSDHTWYALRQLNATEVVIVGGPGAVSDRVVRQLRARGHRVSRVAGPNRFATSTAIVDWAVDNVGLRTDRVALATGSKFADALIGGPFGAKLGLPVVLTEPRAVDRAREIRNWLDAQPLRQGFIVGGRNEVSTWVKYQLSVEIND